MEEQEKIKLEEYLQAKQLEDEFSRMKTKFMEIQKILILENRRKQSREEKSTQV